MRLPEIGALKTHPDPVFIVNVRLKDPLHPDCKSVRRITLPQHGHIVVWYLAYGSIPISIAIQTTRGMKFAKIGRSPPVHCRYGILDRRRKVVFGQEYRRPAVCDAIGLQDQAGSKKYVFNDKEESEHCSYL